MSYIFFGSPEFAAIILKKLIDVGMPPAAVVCNPDRPVGRKKIITPPAVKKGIMNYESEIRNRIKILQPENLDESFKFQVSSFKADLFVVAAYAKILPKKILEIPRLGTIGVHPSLLPKYRGATPIQSAILAGEKESGVTLFLVDEKVDHGPVVSSVQYQVSSKENYESLHDKLGELGGKLLVETLQKFLKGEVKPTPQNEVEATYTKKFTSDDGRVNLEKDDPNTIERKVRALNPEPGVWAITDGRRVKILEGEIADGKFLPKKVQEAGKKPKELGIGN